MIVKMGRCSGVARTKNELLEVDRGGIDEGRNGSCFVQTLLPSQYAAVKHVHGFIRGNGEGIDVVSESSVYRYRTGSVLSLVRYLANGELRVTVPTQAMMKQAPHTRNAHTSVIDTPSAIHPRQANH